MTSAQTPRAHETVILDALYLIRDEANGATDEAREHGIDRLGDAPLHQVFLVAEAAAEIVCTDQDDDVAMDACRIHLSDRVGDEVDDEYRQALWLAHSIMGEEPE
jgi:hypothetical protein